MSVLFVEMDRQSNVLNGGCGTLNQQQSITQTQSQQQQQQQQSSMVSTNSSSSVVAAAAAAVAAANNLEEQRALQLAFELSMLGLSDSLPQCNGNNVIGNDINVDIGMNGVNMNNVCQHSPSSLSPTAGVNDNKNGLNGVIGNNVGLNSFTSMLPSLEDRSKKSQNMTECVPVPSSEHVAEIVGRQGNYHVYFLKTKKCLFLLFFFFLTKRLNFKYVDLVRSL